MWGWSYGLPFSLGRNPVPLKRILGLGPAFPGVTFPLYNGLWGGVAVPGLLGLPISAWNLHPMSWLECRCLEPQYSWVPHLGQSFHTTGGGAWWGKQDLFLLAMSTRNRAPATQGWDGQKKKSVACPSEGKTVAPDWELKGEEGPLLIFLVAHSQGRASITQTWGEVRKWNEQIMVQVPQTVSVLTNI